MMPSCAEIVFFQTIFEANCCSSKKKRGFIKIQKRISWVVPLPRIPVTTRIITIFCRGSRTKPSFATGILGGVVQPNVYPFHRESFRKNSTFASNFLLSSLATWRHRSACCFTRWLMEQKQVVDGFFFFEMGWFHHFQKHSENDFVQKLAVSGNAGWSIGRNLPASSWQLLGKRAISSFQMIFPSDMEILHHIPVNGFHLSGKHVMW